MSRSQHDRCEERFHAHHSGTYSASAETLGPDELLALAPKRIRAAGNFPAGTLRSTAEPADRVHEGLPQGRVPPLRGCVPLLPDLLSLRPGGADHPRCDGRAFPDGAPYSAVCSLGDRRYRPSPGGEAYFAPGAEPKLFCSTTPSYTPHTGGDARPE